MRIQHAPARLAISTDMSGISVTAPGAPICNIVLQHFYRNMVDAIRTTPQDILFESLLSLWFLALVLTGCCGLLVCFVFGVLRWSFRSYISLPPK